MIETTSTELVTTLLDRIAELNPRLNAIREVLADEALAAAEKADRRRAAGTPIGPLDGLPDPRDPWHVPVPATHLPTTIRRVHILRGDYPPAVHTALNRASRALLDAGFDVHDTPPPGIDEAADGWARLTNADSRSAWPDCEPFASDGARAFMAAMFDLVPPVDADEYANLFITRARLARAWSEYQRDTPLIVAPIYAGEVFRADEDVDRAAEIVHNLAATVAVNFLGLPAVAVPVGLVDGLPQAVQVIGPRFGEEHCLRAAEVIETTPSIPAERLRSTACGWPESP
jgi:amidase